MTEGTNQGLFVVVAIVIFGIFVGLTYTLFGSEGLSNDLETIFTDSFPNSNKGSFDKDADYNVGDVIPNEESDFIFDNVDTIIGYKGTSTEVIIPKTINGKKVTTISGDAFNDKGITKLIMPNSLKVIEDGSLNIEENKVVGAFANNTIEEISFSANLEYIGSFAFFSGSLEDVVLPEGLLEIGESAFEENTLEEIEIPATVTKLGDNAFKNNDLKDVSYGKGSNLTNIGGNVFSGNNIKDLEIPKGTTEIADNAYSNSGLESVEIPSGVTSIGNNAFSNNNLTKVSIPNGVTSIGDNSFSNNKLTNVSIPNTVTKIGKEAFKENLLEEVVIPESVIEVDNGSFSDNDLTNVDLPSGLQRIGDYAFYKNKLPIVNLPESLLIIGVHAFEYNELLDVTIPSKLSVIKEWTFAYNKMPKKPTIPTSVVTEEANAFYGNLFDEKVTFTDANLATALALILNTTTDNITKSKLMSLTVIDLSNKNIADLAGIEKAENLTDINLSTNSVIDVSPLTSLSKLNSVNLSNNGNVDLTSLASLGIIIVSEQYDTTIGSVYGSLYYNSRPSGLNSTSYDSTSKTHKIRLKADGLNTRNDVSRPGGITKLVNVADKNGIYQVYIQDALVRTYTEKPTALATIDTGSISNTVTVVYGQTPFIKLKIIDALGNSTEFKVSFSRY